jgi:hypothetical protein
MTKEMARITLLDNRIKSAPGPLAEQNIRSILDTYPKRQPAFEESSPGKKVTPQVTDCAYSGHNSCHTLATTVGGPEDCQHSDTYVVNGHTCGISGISGRGWRLQGIELFTQ